MELADHPEELKKIRLSNLIQKSQHWIKQSCKGTDNSQLIFTDSSFKEGLAGAEIATKEKDYCLPVAGNQTISNAKLAVIRFISRS